MEHHFYFGTFSRTHKVSLSRKQLTLFIAIDKTQAFKQKNENAGKLVYSPL